MDTLTDTDKDTDTDTDIGTDIDTDTDIDTPLSPHLVIPGRSAPSMNVLFFRGTFGQRNARPIS